MLSDDRIQQIEQAIAALGAQWTNRRVYAQVGGSYAELAGYLKDRRVQAHEEPSAVAVEALPPALDPPPAPAPAPAELPPPPDPAPLSPLHRARQVCDQTAAQELALGVEEARLKRQRLALDDTRQTLDIGTPGQPTDAADEERRRQVREVLTQVEAVEAQRRGVHRQRRQAAAAMVEAKDAYEAVQGQAARWLRRLREAQRQARAGTTAQARGDAREELELALGALARLVGQTETHALADDPSAQPDWLRG